MRINVELDNAQAVTPGPGPDGRRSRACRSATSPTSSCKDGRALVGLDIEPRLRRPHPPRRARALLRPRTGLKDMYVQVFPGKEGAPVKAGFTIPIANTLTDVDLDEILVRARRAHARLPHAAGQRRRRGPARQRRRRSPRCFKRFGPTVRDLGRVNRAVAKERVALRRLVTSLAQVNGELRQAPAGPLAARRTAPSATLGAFASEDAALRDAVGELAPTLQPGDGDAERRHAVRRRARADDARAAAGRPRARDASTPRSARSPARRRRSCATQIRPFVARGRAARAATSRPPRAASRRTFPELQRNVDGAQPPRQHARLQPGRPRGARQGRPRRGLPVLAGLARAPDDEPAQRRRRQRPDAPDLPDRAPARR